MANNTPLDKKIKRISKILKENTAEQARQRALQGIRQKPAVELPPRKSIEDEMNAPAPNEKHGHPVAGPGYQEFSSHQVDVPARLTGKTFNTTNMGYRTESFSQREQSFIASAVGGLKRQADAHGLRKEVVFERFAATQQDTPSHLIEAVGHQFGVAPAYLERMGLLSENFSDAGEDYVEVMPESGKPLGRVKPTTRSAFAVDEKKRTENAVTRKMVPGDKEMKQLPPAQRPGDESQGTIKTDAQQRREMEEARDLKALETIQEQIAAYLNLITEQPKGGMSAVYKKKVNELHSKAKSIKASCDKRKEDKKREEQEQDSAAAIQAVAESMNFGANGQFIAVQKQRLDEHQARHMSLLESAQQMLDRGEDYFSNSGWG